MKPWYKVNLDVSNCLVKNLNLTRITGEIRIRQFLFTEICQPDWLNYSKSLGFNPYSVLIFYRDAWESKSARSAHIDIDTVHPFSLKHFSINWCIGGADS